MKRSYTFYNDPGHGWLEVPKADLATLRLGEKITCFSYEDEQQVYLEEDQDKSTFLKAAQQAGWQVEQGDKCTNSESFVRNLDPYQP